MVRGRRGKQGYEMDVVRSSAQDEPNAATVHAAATRACINLDCDVTGPATVYIAALALSQICQARVGVGNTNLNRGKQYKPIWQRIQSKTH